MSTNEKPFKLEIFLPHKTTTGVVLEGYGVRVTAIRSSVKAAVEDALKEWHQRVLEPLIRSARITRARLAQETTFPAPPPEEEDAPGPLPDEAPRVPKESPFSLFPHVDLNGPRIVGITVPDGTGPSTAEAEAHALGTGPGVPFEP